MEIMTKAADAIIESTTELLGWAIQFRVELPAYEASLTPTPQPVNHVLGHLELIGKAVGQAARRPPGGCREDCT